MSRKPMEKLLAEAANSTVRGVEIRKTIAHRNCQTILKANIWIAEDVEKFLGDNGLKVDKDGNCASVGTTVPNSKQKAAQLQRDVDIKNDAASRSQLEIQTLNVSCASDLVRLSDNFINDLNFTQLSTKLMCFIEEDAWSAQNLRKQCVGMKDLGKKELALRNLEYDTGVGRQFHLIGKLRVWVNLRAYLKMHSIARGRRGRDRKWLAKWPGEGFYVLIVIVVEEDAQVSIKYTLTGTIKVVDKKNVPLYNSVDELFLDFNWSEMDTKLKSTSTLEGPGFVVSSLFDASEFPAFHIQNEGNKMIALPGLAASSSSAEPLYLEDKSVDFGTPAKKRPRPSDSAAEHVPAAIENAPAVGDIAATEAPREELAQPTAATDAEEVESDDDEGKGPPTLPDVD